MNRHNLIWFCSSYEKYCLVHKSCVFTKWQCLFCFWFKTFPTHQSSAKTTFGKFPQRPIELEEILEKTRSLNFGATPPVLTLKGCVTILHGGNTRKVEIYGKHMKWRFWGREVEIYVGGIDICNKGIGIDDRGGGKWCETILEWLYTRKISDLKVENWSRR